MNSIKYPLNEIFATIQGEALFAGTSSIFIRLQGCNVGCPWCDTKQTWSTDNTLKVSFITITQKTIENINWAEATLNNIVEYIKSNFVHIQHIVITGGEPAMYNLLPLCNALESLNKTIQLETSGTEEIYVSNNTWVTLSPKISMPNGKKVLDSSAKRANEIKMPIGKMQDIETLKQFLATKPIKQNIPVWLQPLSQNNSATQLCIEQAILNNWKVSIQIHKYIGIR